MHKCFPANVRNSLQTIITIIIIIKISAWPQIKARLLIEIFPMSSMQAQEKSAHEMKEDVAIDPHDQEQVVVTEEDVRSRLVYAERVGLLS